MRRLITRLKAAAHSNAGRQRAKAWLSSERCMWIYLLPSIFLKRFLIRVLIYPLMAMFMLSGHGESPGEFFTSTPQASSGQEFGSLTRPSRIWRDCAADRHRCRVPGPCDRPEAATVS